MSAYTRGDSTDNGWVDAAARVGLSPDEAEDYGSTNTRRVASHSSRNGGRLIVVISTRTAYLRRHIHTQQR
jgi:hypothetical protein